MLACSPTPSLVSVLDNRGLGRPPLSIILSWPAPNRIDPVRKTWLIPYACLFLTLTTILLAARFWSRYKQQSGRFGLDDAIIFPAWIFGVINTALIIVAIKNGFGMHTWDVPLGKGSKAALMGWLSEGCFLMTTGLAKISILLFYRRLSSGSYNRVWKLCTQTAIAFVVLYMVVFIQVLLFVCIPTEAFWQQYDLTYGSDFKCMDGQVPSVLAGTFSVVTDLYSVLLPCWLFWPLQMPRRQKIALWGVFAVGFLTVGCGIARTFYLDKMATTFNADVTWVGYDVMLWSVNEGNLAFICASLPALKPLFVRHLFPPANRAVTAAKAFSQKIASGVNLPRPQRVFHSTSNSRVTPSTKGSQTLVSLDDDVRDRKGNIDWNRFEGYDSAIEGKDEIPPQKVNVISGDYATLQSETGPPTPSRARASLSLGGSDTTGGNYDTEEVKILLEVGERDGESRHQYNGVDELAKSQHSRQASNASNKPLPELPVNT